MKKITIVNPDGDEVLNITPGRKVEIDGHPFPTSHPWAEALKKGKLLHVTLDKAGWTSKAWVKPTRPAPSISANDINVERLTRVYFPKTVTISNGKTVTLDMENGGRSNISDTAHIAREKIFAGIKTDIIFRDSDNVDQTLTTEEFIEISLLVGMQVDEVFKASWVLKALDPLPADFRDNKHWPSHSARPNLDVGGSKPRARKRG